jgi:hypothetical protein
VVSSNDNTKEQTTKKKKKKKWMAGPGWMMCLQNCFNFFLRLLSSQG